MSTMSQIEWLAERLQRRGLRVLLIGGYSPQAHGVVRQPIDTDFLGVEEGAVVFGGILACMMEKQL